MVILNTDDCSTHVIAFCCEDPLVESAVPLSKECSAKNPNKRLEGLADGLFDGANDEILDGFSDGANDEIMDAFSDGANDGILEELSDGGNDRILEPVGGDVGKGVDSGFFWLLIMKKTIMYTIMPITTVVAKTTII